MPVNLSTPKNLLPVNGVTLATAAGGIRYPDRDDMVLIKLVPESTLAAVFTKNKFCAAPVTVAKQNLASNQTQALLINSGNANAGTGSQGMENAISSCQQTAQNLDINVHQVLPFSTGVIGEQLPMEFVGNSIEMLARNLGSDNWLAAANAIMTTDTLPKGSSVTVDLDGKLITITGITKGGGMIKPNMATMLAFVATDADIEQAVLHSMLNQACAASFNRITVDGDTSTNDAAVLIATAQADMPAITELSERQADVLYKAIEKLFVTLATSIVRDAEGATKFVKIVISGAQTESDCEQVAYTVAHSPLVKTALFASDPNWGRILAAVGRVDIEVLEIDQVDIRLNDVAVISGGEPALDYSEEKGQAAFDQAEIEISISLGNQDTSYHVWTSDLSHDYVSINADYRS